MTTIGAAVVARERGQSSLLLLLVMLLIAAAVLTVISAPAFCSVSGHGRSFWICQVLQEMTSDAERQDAEGGAR